MTTSPSVTCPSPPTATPPLCRTARMVVERNGVTQDSPFGRARLLPSFWEGEAPAEPCVSSADYCCLSRNATSPCDIRTNVIHDKGGSPPVIIPSLTMGDNRSSLLLDT